MIRPVNYCCLPLKRVAGSILSEIGGDLVLLTLARGGFLGFFIAQSRGLQIWFARTEWR